AGAGVRELNPGAALAGDVAVAAAGEQAADASESDAERDARGDDVEHFPDRDAVLAQHEVMVSEEADGGAEDRAVQYEPAVPKLDEIVERAIFEPLPVLNDEDKSAAEDAGDEKPDRQIGDQVGVDAFALAQPARQPVAKD